MAKQTAVEWLECELKKIPFINPKQAFEQAKQMEKEQIINAVGLKKSTKKDAFGNNRIITLTPEQYYNEIYK